MVHSVLSTRADRDCPAMASTLIRPPVRLVKTMRGQARITESNVQDMLREVRMALLEADVALPVVRDFIARVKDKALGQRWPAR
jgi:signal recognition particle subunit SRP54